MLQVLRNKNILYLTEIFASVQGETRFAGLPTTFIRLSGCNLRCSWCDTPYSFSRGEPHDLETIISTVKALGCKHVCVTGGEPLLQNLVYTLFRLLCDEGYIVSLETGGSLNTKNVDSRVHVILDIKCPGSGMEEKNFWKNLEILKGGDEIKFVLLDRADYEYAKGVCERYTLYSRELPPLFSPVHGRLDPKILVGWILEDHLSVRLNLQLHKYIWTPETRSV